MTTPRPEGRELCTGFTALIPRVCIPAAEKRSYANSPGYTVAVCTACAVGTAPQWAKPSRQLLGENNLSVRPARDTSLGYWLRLRHLCAPQNRSRMNRCGLEVCVYFRTEDTFASCTLHRRAQRSFRGVAPCTRSFWRTQSRTTGGAAGSPCFDSPDRSGFLSSHPLPLF